MFRFEKAPERMTARERVARTFAYEKTDRVTIGYTTNDIAQAKLYEYVGCEPKDHYDMLRAFGVDYQMVKPRYIGPKLFEDVPDRMVYPETGFRKKQVRTKFGVIWDYCDYPLANATDEELAAYPAPDPDEYDYDEAGAIIDMLHEKGFAVHLGDPALGDILNSNGVLMGFEDSLVNLMTEDEATLAMTDKRLDSQLGVAERVLDKNRGKIDFMWIGDDVGSQKGPLISMDMYQRVLKPRHQKFIDLAKAYQVPIIMHSCGCTSWVFEELISMGLSGVDTLQPEVVRMDPRYIVDHFGGRLNFRGCISTAGPLAYGTPADVDAVCRDTLAIMMEKRGYHFAPTQKIQNNTPPENTVAMLQAAHRYGRY